MLWHRWHPGGLPPEPAHCAALRPHQLRPRGHPRGQVSAGSLVPHPNTSQASVANLSSRESGRECLFPSTCLARSPDPKSPTPASQRTVFPKGLRAFPCGWGDDFPPDRPPPRLHPRNAAEVQDGSQYSVLLIITDGVISDMAQTKEAIVNVSRMGGGQGAGVGLGAHLPAFREMLRPGFSSSHPWWDHSCLLAAVSGKPGSGVGGAGRRGIWL